jgi:hypothetical protein
MKSDPQPSTQEVLTPARPGAWLSRDDCAPGPYLRVYCARRKSVSGGPLPFPVDASLVNPAFHGVSMRQLDQAGLAVKASDSAFLGIYTITASLRYERRESPLRGPKTV